MAAGAYHQQLGLLCPLAQHVEGIDHVFVALGTRETAHGDNQGTGMIAHDLLPQTFPVREFRQVRPRDAVGDHIDRPVAVVFLVKIGNHFAYGQDARGITAQAVILHPLEDPGLPIAAYSCGMQCGNDRDVRPVRRQGTQDIRVDQMGLDQVHPFFFQ